MKTIAQGQAVNTPAVTDRLPFAVLSVKLSGERVLFSRHSLRADAEITVRALNKYGLNAIVEEVRDPELVPGSIVAVSRRGPP